MKQLPRGIKVWLICTGIGLAIHTIAIFILFPIDLIRSLQERSQCPLMTLTFLIFARLFLYFIAPGWGLYLVARTLLERRMILRTAASKSAAESNEFPSNGG